MAEAGQQAAPDGILITDRRGQVVSVNPRFFELWDIPASLAQAGPARALFEAMCEKLVDPDGFLARLRGLVQNRDERAHAEIVLKNGRIFDSYSAPMLRQAGNGDHLGRIWFFRDLTDLRSVQSQVREEEGVLRALTEQDVAGTLIFEPDGRIRYINSKFTQMLGYTVEEVIGRNFADFISEDVRAATVETFRRVAGGKTKSVQVSTQIMVKTGGTVDVIGQLTGAHHMGQPAVIGVVVDVTALKRTEEALEESEDLYRAVVSSMAEGILIVGADATIMACNGSAARILGVPEKEVVGRKASDPAWNLIHEDGTPLLAEDHPSAVTLRQAKPRGEYLVGVKARDGVAKWVATNTQPLFRKGANTPYAAVVSLVDVTSHKLDQDTLTHVNHTLTVLSLASEVVVRAGGEQDLLDRMCQILVDTGGYRLVWIGLSDKEKPALSVRAVAHCKQDAQPPPPADGWEALLCARCEAEVVLASGKPEINQDLAHRDAAPSDGGLVPSSGSRIVLPLLDRGVPMGILTLYSEKTGAFTPDEVRLLVQLAEDLAYGIVSLRERGRREDGEAKLRRSMEAAVQAIASTLEMRDPYTAGHQRDVARLAVAIARDVGVADDQIEGIYLAAIVHDIGKIRIPVDILSKPGPLTKLEYQLIQTHAQVGYDIMKNVDFPWPVAQMILQHHERLDGSGYPAGLKGDEILQGARIIAVADVVQAMSMRRPYRAPFGDVAALDEIERGKGRLYDSAAVDACLKLFREKGFKFL